jgi:SAM-dependent methyltransferase
MNIYDIAQRKSPPKPWEEGDNIPWNEPGFSQRMLQEHLSQAHDAASRRLEIIDRQVTWLHEEVLNGMPARILDLGCGPGLYINRLAQLGHSCTGIDFSPASIQYARKSSEQAGLAITYSEADLRRADYGIDFDLVMQIYGEFNVFRPSDARLVIDKAWQALKPGGCLLLEAHTFEAIQHMGQKPPGWYTSQSGLFSDQPYLLLEEGFWDANSQATTRRYFLVDGASGTVTRYAASYQAYSNEEYRSLLEGQGFGKILFYPSMTGAEDAFTRDFMVILAQKTNPLP